MKKYTVIIIIGICILVSVGITWFTVKQKDDALAARLQSYTETEAIIKKVYPPTFNKYGSKQKRYDLLVMLSDSNTVLMRRKSLDGHFKEGNRVQVLYNPVSHSDKVYLSHKE